MLGNGFNGRKLVLLIFAAVIGGGLGYFGSTLVLDRIKKEDEEPEVGPLEKYERGPLGEEMAALISKRENYSEKFQKEKGDLEALAAKYKPLAQTSIIDETEVDKDNCQTLMYYDCGKIADESGEIVEHPNTMLGANAHLHFGEQSEDPDIVYIRNSVLKLDFELVHVHSTYNKEVLGLDEKLPKQKTKRVKKVEESEDQDQE